MFSKIVSKENIKFKDLEKEIFRWYVSSTLGQFFYFSAFALKIC